MENNKVLNFLSFLNESRSEAGKKEKIKIDNISSLKLFESCGFKKKYYVLEPNV